MCLFRTMYLQCLFVFFLSINSCHCPWVSIGGPSYKNPPKMITIASNNVVSTSLSLQKLPEDAVPKLPNDVQLVVQQSLDSLNDKKTQENAVSHEVESPIEACCGGQLTTAEIDCCGYITTDKDIEDSLNTIVNLTNEWKILDQIYPLINDISFTTQKVVNDLTFAVLVSEMDEKTDTDIVWQFKEQTGTDEIDCILHHDAVSYMVANGIYFKLAILKYNSGQSFNTVSDHGEKFIHGPFIIVQTTAEEGISKDTPVLEFKINKKQLQYPNAQINCACWNNSTHKWETEGITTTNNEKYITCSSTHLSAFSVLMDPYSGSDDYDNNSDLLTILSVIGSLLTIPCVTITIIMYRRNRVRRKKIASKILINCCISLLLLHFSFLLFTFFSKVLPCWLLNFMVHYGGSSTLLWTAADGINMWRKLFVDIFDKRKTVFYRWSKIISWGFPFFTSFIGVIITNYAERRCYIYFNYNMWLYMLPCLLIMTCNVIFFSIMFINVVCKDKIKSLTGRKKKYVMSLVQVFGLLWCVSFPLLWIKATRLLGHIAFTIFVSNQGIIIFFVRCVNEREIRGELLQYTIYRKIFHRVLTINDDKNCYKTGKAEVTGIFALSSGSGKSFMSSSETYCIKQ